jgi:quercetin dioxygenase-like cupin family protein
MQKAATRKVMDRMNVIDTAYASRWTVAAMESRVVRYADLRPCYNAFIDTRTPGSEAKENFTIIGPGVSENPEQHVHIAEPHGFNIGGARQPPGCVNSQHSHNTAEVFVVHTGTWRFDLGEYGDDAQVVLHPGDVISLPTGMFRGFTNIGDDVGYLFAVLGGDDPGRVLWAPHVFDMAARYGLVLLENGQLIDTVAGQSIPSDARPMPRTSAEQAAALHRATENEAEKLVWRASGASAARATTTAVIGEHAPLSWPHPFTLDRLALGETTAFENVSAPEVLFVQSGALTVAWADGAIILDQGDTMTVPVGLNRSLSGTGVAYRVSG